VEGKYHRVASEEEPCGKRHLTKKVRENPKTGFSTGKSIHSFQYNFSIDLKFKVFN
jgi:hypothetical protein